MKYMTLNKNKFKPDILVGLIVLIIFAILGASYTYITASEPALILFVPSFGSSCYPNIMDFKNGFNYEIAVSNNADIDAKSIICFYAENITFSLNEYKQNNSFCFAESKIRSNPGHYSYKLKLDAEDLDIISLKINASCTFEAGTGKLSKSCDSIEKICNYKKISKNNYQIIK